MKARNARPRTTAEPTKKTTDSEAVAKVHISA
jgi:hypothetical protein